jgi:glutamate-5-semialdehyde dehydrogenase
MLVTVLRTALSDEGLPAEAVQLLAGRERSIRRYLVSSTGLVDLLLVRGGDRLAGLVREDATVPMIVLGSGSCHVYVDASAELSHAIRVVLESKTMAPVLPHAVHTVLVHADIADTALPSLARALGEVGIAMHADPQAEPLLPGAIPINEEDWISEYLGPDIALKVVDSLEKAVEHIARYGAGHTEVVVTQDQQAAQVFLQRVDAATVKVNVPTTPEPAGCGLVCTQKLQFRGPLQPISLTATITHAWSAAGSP